MSSDDDYFPSDGSSCGLRRSKRITRQDIRKPKGKTLRKDRVAKKSTTARNDKKAPKNTKQKSQNAPNEVESCAFSGEALTQAELHQLWIKFTRDGHFRCKPSISSSAQPSVSKGSDDARASGKKRHRSHEKKSTVTSEKASKGDNIEREVMSSDKQDLLSVTLSNPLPNASGSTLHISASRSQYAAAFPSERRKSWTGPIICRNFLASGSFRAGNNIDLSCRKTSFPLVAPKPYPLAPIANTCKPTFNEASSSSAFKTYEKNNDQLNNLNDANPCGFYCYGNNSQISYSDNSTIVQVDRANRDNAGNYSNGTKLPPPQVRPNNLCGNFDQTGSPQGFQGRQMSMVNPAFPAPNQSSYGNASWNEIDFNVPNIFSNENPSAANDGFDLQNSIDHVTSSFRSYNPEMQSSSNVYGQGFGDSVNSMIDYGNKLSGHHLSLMAWNSLQVYQNPYSTGNELSYANNYNCPIPYDGSISSMIVNEPGNLVDPNYWTQKNSSNRGFYGNDAVKTSATIGTSDSTSVIPVTSTTTAADESLAIARMNDKVADKGSFDFDDFPDSQDDDFCPTVSSICSYDDDISYEKYIDDSLVDNNALSKTQNRGPNVDQPWKIKVETRPLRDGTTNHSQRGFNDPRRNDENSHYDSATKDKVSESLDCVILENLRRA